MLPIVLTALALTGVIPGPDTTGAWMAPAARCETLAATLHIAPTLKPIVTEMCQRAPTFRRQVVRLARHRGLGVRVSLGPPVANGRARARTTMTRVDGQLHSAIVDVPFGDAALVVELVAHEFEHILEQLDGVDLNAWAGRSGVERLGRSNRDGPFETERARQVGRVVAVEYLSAGAGDHGLQGTVMGWPLLAASWPLLAAAWVMSASPPEAPCAGGLHVARQQHGGQPEGVASADVSADGRIVAFASMARLAEADVNTVDDVYVVDRTTGPIRLASGTAAGGASDGSSRQPRLSGDGRFLVFSTIASNLIGSRIDGLGSQVLRQDCATGVNTLVSHTPAGAAGNGWSGHADISADGRYVVFESQATDLVAGRDANLGGSDIYLFDAHDGTIRRVSITDAGGQSASGQSATPAISGNGRFVAFASTAPIDALARARPDVPVRSIYRRDLATGETRRISVARGGGVPNASTYYPAIDGDGRRIVFVSPATNLDGDRRGRRQEHLYLHDTDTGRLRILTHSVSGGSADGDSRHPALSDDGRFVVFSSEASDLRCADRCGPLADRNLVSDVYRLDIATGVVDRVSGGGTAREAWWRSSGGPATDGTGQVVVFSSRQPIDEADLEDDDDLFVEILPAGAEAGGPDGRGPVPCTAGPARPPAQSGFGQPPVHLATERRRAPSMP